MTVFELYKFCESELEKNKKADAGTEARLILQKVFGFDRTQLLLSKDNLADAKAVAEAQRILEQREKNIPLQYILGEWDFYGQTFKVGEGVLIPRPETEELCTAVIERLKKMHAPTVFDLCAGSGCIGITLKKQVMQANVYLVEYFDEALGFLNENRMALSVARSVPAIKGDVLEGYEKFGFLPRPDVIVLILRTLKKASFPPFKARFGANRLPLWTAVRTDLTFTVPLPKNGCRSSMKKASSQLNAARLRRKKLLRFFQSTAAKLLY